MILGIPSHKGGVGKTTLTANLGAALYMFKKRVLLVDNNPLTRDLPLWFDMYLPSDSKKKTKAGYSIYTYTSGLDLMPYFPSEEREDPTKFKKVLEGLKYDYVILDGAPGHASEVSKTSDQVLIPLTPSVAAVKGAVSTTETAREEEVKIMGYVVLDLKKEKHEVSLPEMRETFDTPVIETITHDDLIPKCFAEGAPVIFSRPDSKPAIEFKKLAAVVLGREYEPTLKEKIKSKLWNR